MKRPNLNKLIDPTDCLSFFDQIHNLDKTQNILCATALVDYKMPALEWMSEELPEYRFLLMNQNETPRRKGKSTTDQMLHAYYGNAVEDFKMEFFPIPAKLMRDEEETGISFNLTDGMKELLKDHPYLSNAAQNLGKRYPGLGEGYAELCVCVAYDFFSYVLEKAKPVLVLMWNLFTANHSILDALCKERRIPVVYNEFGVLPGTFCYELGGQMGESEISKNFEEFQTLVVDDADIEKGKKVWEYLYNSKLNRRKQPVNDEIKKLKLRLKPDRPVILYFGQNDYESGLYPYTEHTRQYHSPVFTGSDEAAGYLAQLAEKYDWNFVYKPHPILSSFGEKINVPSNVIVVDQIDINALIDMSDLCITILSQTGYVSTIRKKATLMLGYNQLKGKGCTYEAFKKSEIEPTILRALECGFTQEQSRKFEEHIARLVKYYLYDDLLPQKKYVYANDVHKMIAFLRLAIEGNDQFSCMRQIASLGSHTGTRVSITESIREIDAFMISEKKPVILFVGHICYDHEVDYLYQLAKRMPAYQWILLTEHYRANYDKVYQINQCTGFEMTDASELKNIKIFIVPELFTKNANVFGWKMSLSEDMKQIIENNEYVKEAKENLYGRHQKIAEGFPEAFAANAYIYLNRILDIFKPASVMMWNKFHAFHHILSGVCTEKGINPLYMEFGSLPGTYVIEGYGQMGESWCAQEYKKFLSLPVTRQEEENAAQVWEYLYKSKLSRRKSSQNSSAEKKRVLSLLRPNRPTIFYAGQNDFESGFFPYTANTKKNHSPIFHSSDEAATFLVNLAKKNDWNFIYKPHPIITQYTKTPFSDPHAIVAEEMDINDAIDISTVTVTVFSQSGYMGLIRKKPVVMLGYTQLKGKNVCYESFEKETIESTILKAIENGFIQEQQKAFTHHIAQMLRYSLLSDLHTTKDIGYGADISCAVEFIISAANGKILDVLPPYRANLQGFIMRARKRNITLDELDSFIRSPEIKIISFDVFDTLLCRPVIKPVDLFKIVGMRNGFGREFVFMRKSAERAASLKKDPTHDALTLSEIYKSMADLFDIDPQIVSHLMCEEIRVERQYLRPRESAMRLFRTALSTGKPIIIVSDMYLSGEDIGVFLKENGYDGYEKLYVSCELMQSKKTGRLYDTVLEECRKKYGIEPYEMLHVGDNFQTDVDEASRHGISAVYFPKAMDCWNTVPMLKSFSDSVNTSLDNSFLIGLSAQKIFDNPYGKFDKESYTNGKWENLAIVFYGPFMIAFTKWLIETSLQNKNDKIFFLMRDGYLPEKIYQKMSLFYKNAPSHALLHLNRSLMYPFSAKGKGSLILANFSYCPRKEMKVSQFIIKRLLVSDDNEYKEILGLFNSYGYKSEDLVKDALQQIDLIEKLNPYFLKNALPKKMALKKYLFSALQNSKNPVFYDTGYRGRASFFVKNNLDLMCGEYHILSRPELDLTETSGCLVESFIRIPTELINAMSISHVFMDDVFSEQTPGVCGISESQDKSVEWEYETGDPYSVEIEKIQKGILDYVDSFVSIFQEDLKLFCFDRYQLFGMLHRFFTVPGRNDAKLFEKLRTPMDASFTGIEKMKNYEVWYNKQVSRIDKKKFEALHASQSQNRNLIMINSTERYAKVKYVLRKLGILEQAKKIYHKLFG